MKNEDTNKIITVGNYSPSNHNASRIVSIYGLAPTVMENHGTVTAILEYKQNKNIKGEINSMTYIKNLTKLNFNMNKIKLFDSFAGLGALHQSLKELGVPTELVGMSEIDVDAIISYSGVHNLDLNKIDFLLYSTIFHH